MLEKKDIFFVIIVTALCTVVVLCIILIILVKKGVLCVNNGKNNIIDNIISTSASINEKNELVAQNKNISYLLVNNFSEHVNGKELKDLIELIISSQDQEAKGIIVYINQVGVAESEASKELEMIELINNIAIVNSNEYISINEELQYKLIIEKNLNNVVEKIYAIRIIGN